MCSLEAITDQMFLRETRAVTLPAEDTMELAFLGPDGKFVHVSLPRAPGDRAAGAEQLLQNSTTHIALPSPPHTLTLTAELPEHVTLPKESLIPYATYSFDVYNTPEGEYLRVRNSRIGPYFRLVR